jgi:hypothetical protein
MFCLMMHKESTHTGNIMLQTLKLTMTYCAFVWFSQDSLLNNAPNEQY